MAVEIVGREAELRALHAFLDNLTQRAAALVVRGEAGIGKTTLWTAATEAALASGIRTLSCRPASAEQRLAFAALTDLLLDVAEEVLPALPPPQRLALEIALALESSDDEPPEARMIATACASALRHLARSGPLLVAIDDVQWLDPASAGVLEFAARRLAREASGFLVAERVEDDGAPVPLGLARDYPELEILEVGPLTLGAVNHLLRERLGLSLPRPALHRVHRASAGNPFYALELGRAIARRGLTNAIEPLPVPTTLGLLVRERLADLPDRVRDVLALAACLTDASTDVVFLAGGDGEAIDQAIASGVLQASGRKLRFTHPLLASTVYSDLRPHERRRIHAGLAAVVTDPEERAHQLALATVRPDEEVAGAIERAAALAESRGAPIVAAGLLERAIELTPAEARPAQRARIARLVDLCVVGGDVDRASMLAEGLVESATADERLDALALLAIVRLSEGRREAVVELVDEVLGTSSPDERARAVALILSATVDVRRLGRAETLLRGREAVTIGERLGDPNVVRDALVGVAIDAAWLGEPFVADVERAAAMGHVRGIFPVGHRAESVAAIVRMLFGDELSTTRPALEARYREALASESAEAQAEALSTLSELERRSGRLRQAAEHGAAGLELGDVYLRATLCFMTGFARALQGELDAADDLAEEGFRVADQAPASARIQLGWLRGAVDLLRGAPESAAEYLAQLPQLAEELGIRNPTPIQFHPDLVEALLGAGRIEDAADVAARLDAGARTVGHVWALAAAHRCQGLVHAARGEHATALSELEQAVRLSERICAERPLEHGRALLAHGATLRRMKRRRDARAALMRAEELFLEHGARPWADRTRDELARISGRTPSRGELTETERRVAELVAEGLSNKEVAARLFVTPRTVEAHLTSVYAKLGLRSRSELASRLART